MDSSQRALQTNEKLFFQFQIRFEILAAIQKNSEPIDQIAKYQWIWLDKLYKLMKSFFQIPDSFLEYVTIFENNRVFGFMQARWGRPLCWTARVLVGRVKVNISFFCNLN